MILNWSIVQSKLTFFFLDTHTADKLYPVNSQSLLCGCTCVCVSGGKRTHDILMWEMKKRKSQRVFNFSWWNMSSKTGQKSQFPWIKSYFTSRQFWAWFKIVKIFKLFTKHSEFSKDGHCRQFYLHFRKNLNKCSISYSSLNHYLKN